MDVDLYSVGEPPAQGCLGCWRRGWDQATARFSNSVQITVCSSPKTYGQLMQGILVGKKQKGSDTARYFYLCQECSSGEVILLDSGDLNSWTNSATRITVLVLDESLSCSMAQFTHSEMSLVMLDLSLWIGFFWGLKKWCEKWSVI